MAKHLVAAVLFAFISGRAETAPVIYDFAGTWGNVPGLSGDFAGSFSYDPLAAPISASSTQSVYTGLAYTLDVFGDGSTTLSYLPTIGVSDDLFNGGSSTIDAFQVGSSGPNPALIPFADLLPTGSIVEHMVLDFVDVSSSLYTDTSLPISLDPTDFDSLLLTVRFAPPSGGTEVGLSQITSLSLRQQPVGEVPLPSSLLLLLAGLGTMAGSGLWQSRVQALFQKKEGASHA